jgi:hypothetical protein
MLLITTVNAQPVVEFDAPVPECLIQGNLIPDSAPPQYEYYCDITFSDALVTGGTITTIKWNYGDGTAEDIYTTPRGEVPHRYRTFGRFPVSLEVTFAGEPNPIKISKHIDIYETPKVTFSFSEFETIRECRGTPIKLQVAFDRSKADVLWSTGETTQSIEVNETKKFGALVYSVNPDKRICKVEKLVYVQFVDPPTVVVTPNFTTITNLDDPIQMNASGADTYSWWPPDGLSATNIANPKAKPEKNTTYTVTGRIKLGATKYCESKTNVAIHVDFVNTQPHTPLKANNVVISGTRFNTFRITDVDVYNNNGFQMYIYNKWGKEVYKTTGGYHNDWSGEDLPEDAYYYIFTNDAITHTGSISIIRNK